jgi:hypothetical protein
MAPYIAHLPFENAGGDLEIPLQRLHGIRAIDVLFHIDKIFPNVGKPVGTYDSYDQLVARPRNIA